MTVSSVPPPALELKTLGRHRLIASIGQGGMADVHLAVLQGQLGVSKLLVVKALRSHLAGELQFQRMFIEEARLAVRMNHPNLVQTFEAGEDQGRHYMTMEYLEGQPLHIVRKRVDLPLDIQARILALVLAGLHHAHEMADFDGCPLHVVHRDVSPQNVFVTYDGHVKVVDFGIAKVAGGSGTEVGVIKGKVNYMAPEQALGLTVDRRADVFAVGVMLWEAVAGRRYAPADEPEGVTLQRRMNGDIQSPRDVAPNGPEELLSACEKALAFEPDKRFATAAAFQEALEAYLERVSTRVGSKQIAAIMAAFASERARVRALVERQLSSVDQAGDVTIIAVPATATTARHERIQSKRESRNRRVLAGAALLVVAAVFAGTFALRRAAPRAAVVPAQASAEPSILATSMPPAVDAASTPVPSVQLRVSAQPSAARISLDGVSLDPNPFIGAFPRASAERKLVVEAPGFQRQTRVIVFDRDVDLKVSLVRAREGARVVSPPLNTTTPIDDSDPYAP